jgi:hypothetical protein
LTQIAAVQTEKLSQYRFLRITPIFSNKIGESRRKKVINSIDFYEYETPFFRRKLAQIAKNSFHNIGPWLSSPVIKSPERGFQFTPYQNQKTHIHNF